MRSKVYFKKNNVIGQQCRVDLKMPFQNVESIIPTEKLLHFPGCEDQRDEIIVKWEWK